MEWGGNKKKKKKNKVSTKYRKKHIYIHSSKDEDKKDIQNTRR